MAKQLNVNLAFTADTSKAKAQIQELYQNLNNVSTTTAKLPITTQIQEAQTAAIQLKTAMNQAFDVNTGKLDLLKFNQSIKTSGTSLKEIRDRLVSIGPVGQQTFLSLAQSIAAAEIPAKRTSALLTNLGVTLKNTVKWQLSSSMLHGFMGAVQSAYGYVQNLNSSLNDIRIVTGQSAEEMDRFAARANKAAKALSASTLDYTNAALIYYQQGLNDKEVEERTNVTVKMANVTGKTAQEISQQMTAVWNNFDDGSKSLEYYADVMTALGAATASSTDEISQGLQKFSAVAETVGLSYEYATAALATITATTRESADVVGTALKTLFARIQGLKLGETLEDGTDLNKYSQALAKVGISIFEQNGELKDMDNILNEMAAKWETLSSAQQTALAQTVAGVRQYTQLVALMENWDFMESNLDIAYGATGTLNEQAEIYAESWEGARDRVKAAAEAIYSNLLKDDFFIDFTNGIEKVLTLLNHFIESIGGAKGVLLGLSSILLHTFSNTVASNIENMVYNIKSFVGVAQREAINTQNLAVSLGQNNQTGNVDTSSQSSGTQVVSSPSSLNTNVTDATTMGMQAQLQLTHAIAQKRDSMTAAQQEEASAILAQNQAYADQLILLAQKADTARTNKTNSQDEIMDLATLSMSATKVQQILSEIDEQVEFGEKISSEVAEAEKAFKSGEMSIDAYQKKLQELSELAASKNLSKTSAILGGMSKKSEADLQEKQVAATVRGRARAEVTQNAKNNFNGTVSDDSINQHVSNVRNAIKANDDYARSVNNMQTATANASKKILNFSTTIGSVSQSIVKASQTMMSLSFAINSFKNLGNILSDESLSGGEKILQTFMSLGMAIPMLVNGLTGLNSILGITSVLQQSAAVSAQLYLASHQQSLAILTAEQQAELANNMAKATGMSLDQAKIQVSNAVGAAKLQEAFASKTLTAESTAEQIAAATGIGMDQAEVISSKLQAGATLEEATAEAGLTATKTTGIAATMMATFTKGLETGARWANVVAMIAEATAMSPLLIMTLLLVAAMAALVAVIAGVVAIAKAISNAYNADAIAAERAAEAAQELADRYKTVKQEYEDMISAMENYQTAREGLDNLTKGTEEYQEALKEANRLALELINTYGLIAGTDYEWQGNELVIFDDAMKRIQQDKANEVDIAYAASQMGAINAKEKQTTSDTTDLRRKVRNESNGANPYQSNTTTPTTPYAAAQTSPYYNTATPYAAAQQQQSTPLTSAQKDAIFDKAIEIARTNQKLFTTKQDMATILEIDDENLINALWENRDAIQQLSNEMNANAEAEELVAQNTANEIMADSQYHQTSSGKAALEAGGALYQKLYNNAEQTYLNTKMTTAEGKKIWDRYAELQGISELNGYKVTNYNKDGNVVYKYLDEQNQWQEGVATKEMIAQTLAAADAAAQLGKEIGNLANVYADKTEAQRDAMTAVITGDTSHLNVQDIGTEKTAENVKNAEHEDYLTEEDLKALGYTGTYDEMVNAYVADFNKLASEAETQLTNILTDQVSSISKIMNDLNLSGAFKDLNLGEVAQLGDILTEALISGGLDSVNYITDMFNQANEAGQGDEFIAALSGIDWDTITPDQLSAALKEAGVTINFTEGQLQLMINGMKDTGLSAAEASAQLAKLSSILKDLKVGQTISAETYQELEEMGIDVDQYFLKMSDGTYQLIASADEFYNQVKQGLRAQAQADIEERQSDNRYLKTAAAQAQNGSLIYGASNVSQWSHMTNADGTLTDRGITQANVRLSTLEAAGYDPAQLADWQAKIDAGTMTAQDLVDMSAAVSQWVDKVGGLNNAYEIINGTIEKNVDIMGKDVEQIASGAESVEELDELLRTGQITKEAYDKAFETVLANESGLDLKELQDMTDMVQELADGTNGLSKELKTNRQAAAQVAAQMLRYNKAVKQVTSNQEKWMNTLKTGSWADISAIMDELAETYGDMLNIDGSKLSKQFLRNTKNLELMQQAANGNVDAFNQLQEAAGKDIMGDLYGNAKNTDKLKITLMSLDEINAAINRIAAAEGVNVGDKVTFDSTLGQDVWNVFQNAYDAAIAGGASVTEAIQAANDAIAAIGFEIPDSDYEVYTEKVTTTGPSGFTAAEDGSVTAGNPPTVYQGVKFVPTQGQQTTVEVPKIRKKGNGSGAVKTNETGGSGTGSNKGGGGGGGGGKKPKKAKEVKKTDIVDRYKEIEDKIDDLTESMNDASEAADRMYGNDHIKQMEKVNKLLKEEIGLIEQKKSEAYAYLQEDQQNLEKAASEAGVSFEFGENGNITNYTEQMTKLYEQLNSAIQSANADGDATEDEQENIDKIQERIDKVKEAIEQYDETKELIEDLDNDIQDKLYEIYDNALESFEYKIELDLELSEDSMKIIEFQLGQIEDDAFKAAESIALTSQKAENLYDTLMTNRNALDEAFGLSDIAWDLGIMQEGQEFTEAQIDLMKEYRDNIMDVIEEMSELRETVEEQVMEVFEAWNDKLETNMDTLDHFGSMLDSYKNIVDIVGQDTMGLSEGFMQGIQEASVEHALDQMHATKEAYETMMSARLRAEQALEDARARGDDASAKMWEETLAELNSNMESAQEDMLSSWENALSTIQDNFEATVERVVETFNNAVYAFGGMEGLSNEFSRQKEMADLMVDDYQKIYELSKLNRNIQKTLDDTDVIAGKQKLLKLQEKINALEEEGVELSQYDLEYLQAEYELRMAEIELENAQAKKDTVRLSKDNEGNWSYIYTTSMDAVDAAHQKYEDALYAMQELSSNYVDEMSEQLISTSQEMAEALAEVRASDFASQEDYEKELDRIRKMYQERLDQQESELQKSIDNNKELYTQDWTNYHEATGYKISDTENFVTSFKDTLLGALMDSESDTANFNSIMSSSVDILTTGLVDAAATYYSHMEQAMQAAGTSTNDFAADMQENIDTVVQKSEEGAAAVEDMAEKMASAFWDISDSVNQWQEGYGSAMQQVIDSNLAVVESFNNMLKELSIDPDSIKVEYDISTDYGLENASSMDTGGYTGTWGTAGKLAILHEKELVLNPDDTSNFLQAIGISKTLLETIDLNARQASNGMGLLSAAGFRDSSNGTLEQNVHIEATFPNVTDHNEIEEAMKNLVNTASQYANRK